MTLTVDAGSSRPRASLIVPLFFLSGAAGLVYQIVWLRELTLVFGATAYASSAVLSTFMGGLALGSFWASRRADRWAMSPLRAYGALEIGIAAYAGLIPWLLRSVTPLLGIAWHAGASEHFALFGVLKFVAIAILILPATTLMGATLPVLARAARSWTRALGGGVGALYAANTFGAVIGTLLSAFLALPALGMRRTLAATIAVNLLVGAIAWVSGGHRPGSRDGKLEAERGDALSVPRERVRSIVIVFAASGFAAMVIEVAWTRGLALVLGSSVYAYAAMLTAFLLGLASGAAVAARVVARRRVDAAAVLTMALAGAGAATFATAYVLQALPRALGEIYFRWQPSPNGWLIVEIVLALAVMFPSTFALGWVFPLVLEITGPARGAAAAVGKAYAANTCGTIFGALAGGFLAIPILGVSDTLVLVAIVQGLLAIVVAWHWIAVGARSRRIAILGSAAVVLLSIAGRPSWDVQLMNSGVYFNVLDVSVKKGWAGFLKQARNNVPVYAKEGLTASIFVGSQPPGDNLYLSVNGKVDASSRGDIETQIMAGQIPLFLHPDPKDVLVVGLASGMSVGSVATHPVDRIRVVEVEPAIVGAARCFSAANGDVLNDPRVTVSINDARNELQFNTATYDVIVSEPSNPWMTVASNLFTEEFFQIARARLRPGGIYAQWMQMYCLSPEYLRSIIASLHASFPNVLIFETGNAVDLLVIGSDRPLHLDRATLKARMSELRVWTELARVGAFAPEDLLAMVQTGGADIDRIVAGSARNTDDNGFVEFAAPKLLYADTLDDNAAMLLGSDPDPVSKLLPLLADPGDTEKLRLELIPRWVRREQPERAKKAALAATDPATREEAEKLAGIPQHPHS